MTTEEQKPLSEHQKLCQSLGQLQPFDPRIQSRSADAASDRQAAPLLQGEGRLKDSLDAIVQIQSVPEQHRDSLRRLSGEVAAQIPARYTGRVKVRVQPRLVAPSVAAGHHEFDERRHAPLTRLIHDGRVMGTFEVGVRTVSKQDLADLDLALVEGAIQRSLVRYSRRSGR